MAGVYARSEFTDLFGIDYKVEIYDTTYGSGIVYPFTSEGNSFLSTYNGIDDKPLLTPAFKSNITVQMLIKSTDTAIISLLNELPNGKEDQYYLRIYKDTGGGYTLWFVGMILTDACQYNDAHNYIFELAATDGLNRLENFDYPIDDIGTDMVSEMDAIRYALSICGVERFYTDTEPYMAIATCWTEVNAAKIKTALVETRISKQSFIEDVDAQRPKTAISAIEDILKPYGATIRFEEGMWRICQLELLNSDEIEWEYYTKLGALESTETVANETVVGVSDNETKDVMVNMHLPSLYGVGINISEQSHNDWGINQDLEVASNVLTQSFVAQSANALQLEVEYGFTAPFAGQVPIRLYIEVKRDGKLFLRKKLGSVSSTWVNGPSVPTGLIEHYHEVQPQILGAYYKQKLKLVIPPSPGTLSAAAGQTIEVNTWVYDHLNNTAIDWHSYKHTISDYSDVEPTKELSFEAFNDTYNAASVFIEEELKYCDSSKDQVVGAKEIYNGTDWVRSAEWADNDTDTEGVPLAQLLAQQCIYWQRYPRLLVQGSFMLGNHHSLKSLVWRTGRRFILLNGKYEAATATWTGLWMIMLKETTGISGGVRNPYRDVFTDIKTRLDRLDQLAGQGGYDVGTLTGAVYDLNHIVVSPKDTDYEVEPDESNLVFTNPDQATSSTIKYVLPPIKQGLKYGYSNDSNAKTIQIELDTDDETDGVLILFNGSTGATLETSTISFIKVEAISDTRWQVTQCDNPSNWTLT